VWIKACFVPDSGHDFSMRTAKVRPTPSLLTLSTAKQATSRRLLILRLWWSMCIEQRAKRPKFRWGLPQSEIQTTEKMRFCLWFSPVLAISGLLALA
jgi:hypothetical protein